MYRLQKKIRISRIQYLLPRLANKLLSKAVPSKLRGVVRNVLYNELEDQDLFNLNQAFMETFGHSLKTHYKKWAKPHWAVTLNLNESVVSYYSIVLRDGLFDNSKVRIAGIGGVLTNPRYRGLGYMRKLLSGTENFIFNKLSVDVGLLICQEHMIDFYKKMHWYEVKSPLYYTRAGKRERCQIPVMLLSKDRRYHPKMIDLCGLPW